LEKHNLDRQLFTRISGKYFSFPHLAVFSCCLPKPKSTLQNKMLWDHLGWNVTHGVYIWHNNARQLKMSFQSGIITSSYSLPQIITLIKPFLLKLQTLT